MYVTLYETLMGVVIIWAGLMQVKTIDFKHISGNVLI